MKNKNSNIENRYLGSIILYAVGDTLGYRNKDLKHKNNQMVITEEITNELLHEFINLGGINDIDLSDWIVSQHTIFCKCILNVFIKKKYDFNEDLIKLLREDLLKNIYEILNDKNKDRNISQILVDASKKFVKNEDCRTDNYNSDTGNNIPALRSCCLGLIYNGKQNRQLLYDASIVTSKLTNTSVFGYLSGLTSALFTAFAIENIDVSKWPFLLVDVLNSKDVKKYVGNNDDEKNDYNMYINYWMKYIDNRFQDGVMIKTKAHTNLIFRAKFHFINFTEETNYKLIGESGFGVVIMAYDSLLDAGRMWEKLVIYSTLHFGDCCGVGALSSSWYGAIYGYENIPKNNYKHVENFSELKDIGEKIYADRYRNV